MKVNLTPKQEKFCHVYIETGNATEAYRQCYSHKKMKESTINRNAKTLIDSSKISARIQVLQDELKVVHDIKKERLIYELRAMLNTTTFDFLEFDFDHEVHEHNEETGEHIVKIKPRILLKDPDSLTLEQKRAVKSIKVDKDGNFEVTLHDKNWVTDRINKMLGFEAPKLIDHTSKGDKINTGSVIILPDNGRGDAYRGE